MPCTRHQISWCSFKAHHSRNSRNASLVVCTCAHTHKPHLFILTAKAQCNVITSRYFVWYHQWHLSSCNQSFTFCVSHRSRTVDHSLFRLRKAAGYTVQSYVSITADVSDVKGWWHKRGLSSQRPTTYQARAILEHRGNTRHSVKSGNTLYSSSAMQNKKLKTSLLISFSISKLNSVSQFKP